MSYGSLTSNQTSSSEIALKKKKNEYFFKIIKRKKVPLMLYALSFCFVFILRVCMSKKNIREREKERDTFAVEM